MGTKRPQPAGRTCNLTLFYLLKSTSEHSNFTVNLYFIDFLVTHPSGIQGGPRHLCIEVIWFYLVTHILEVISKETNLSITPLPGDIFGLNLVIIS